MESVEQLSGVRCRTVIINVHTDLITARALLSALAHNALPVLVINCDPTEASRKVFETLMSTYEFDLIEAPLALHGTTLDWVFSSLPDERVLLLDSDAEIRKDGFVEWMGDKLDHGLCFGAGFLWGPFLIDEEWKSPPGAEILYMERPWIPCVMLKVEPVRSALAAGVSFNATRTPNEFQGCHVWQNSSEPAGGRRGDCRAGSSRNCPAGCASAWPPNRWTSFAGRDGLTTAFVHIWWSAIPGERSMNTFGTELGSASLALRSS